MNVSVNKGLALIRSIPFYPVIQTKIKQSFLSTGLLLLGVAFEEVAKRVPELRAEIAYWEDGRRFGVGVLPNGPYITLEKRGDMIYFLGKGLMKPDVSLLFKNLDSGMYVFSGLMGAHTAVAENRVLVKGNNSYAMEATRAMSIVQAYLLPGIVHKIIFKDPPKFSFGQILTKIKVSLALGPGIFKHLF